MSSGNDGLHHFHGLLKRLEPWLSKNARSESPQYPVTPAVWSWDSLRRQI